MKKLKKLGKNTSKVEVHTTENGLWLLVNDAEYFLPLTEYPWFKKASLGQLHDVSLINNYHLRWPQLDVDLELESLDNLEKYPLKFK
jgi:hypothetical protein